MKSDDYYKKILKKALFGYAYHRIITDDSGSPVDYEFIDVNHAFEMLTGLKSADILNRRVTEVLHDVNADKFDWISHYADVAVYGGEKIFEQYSHCLGRWYRVQVFSPEKNYIASIFTDITDHKITETALHDDVWRFAGIIEGTHAGTWEWNVQTGETVFNDIWAEIIGYTLEELAPVSIRTWERYAHPDDLKKSDEMLTKHFAGELPYYDCECRMMHKDGSWIYVRDRGKVVIWTDDGKPLIMFGTHEDITERKKIEIQRDDALKALESQSLLQSLLVEILTTYINLSPRDIHSTVQDSLSKMAQAVKADRAFVFKYDFDKDIAVNSYEWCAEGIEPQINSLKALPLSDISEGIELHRKGEVHYIPDVLSLPAGKLRETLDPQGVKSLITVPMMNKTLCEGSVGFDFVRAHHVFSGSEKNLLAIFAQMLVTVEQRKQAEEHRKSALDLQNKLQAQLSQAQKMESVGRLAGGIAHDFNNMLGVILGHAEMAMERNDPGEPVIEDLVEIQKAARRSADLTQQLMAFARKQAVTPQVLDLNKIVEGMLNMLTRLIGEGIKLKWNPGRDLLPVNVDPSQIDQILVNLCVNARDASGNKGCITIGTNPAVFNEAFCAEHEGALPGEYTQLSIADNGGGMDRETLERLFEPFFTTKELGKGTGLGLATVYGIVKQNRGYINVSSKPGAGSVFSIYLPCYIDQPEAVIKAEPEKVLPGSGAGSGSETILVVEDEPEILGMVKTMLERQGYNIMAASTPDEAIRAAGNYAGVIHLLITDVIMPEMNGRELALTISSIYPGMKQLFMSGYTADVIAHQGVLEKGVHFIQKPFSIKELAGRVRSVLDSEA